MSKWNHYDVVRVTDLNLSGENLTVCVLRSDLKNVNCCPYIQGLRVRLGYSPNGGTIMVKIRAMRTKLAGRTI